MRSELRERITGGLPIGVLTTLEPLLEEFDPVEVAAAALMNMWQKRKDPEAATWTRIRADIGKRDGIRAGDLVGALANAVGIQPADVGRIDLRGVVYDNRNPTRGCIKGTTGSNRHRNSRKKTDGSPR